MDKKGSMLQKNINDYLLERGLSQTIIDSAQLGWDGARIIIPVFDSNGNFLFNKYRRSPFTNEGPKYMYDKGSTSALYNVHTIKENTCVIITEGEMDALRLQSAGYGAVSTTGGSSTFKEEWKEFFKNKTVLICYDNDDAGFKGALHVLEFIPEAKVILLPETKDVTEFLQKYPVEKFRDLFLDAQRYDLSGRTKVVLDRLVDQMRKMVSENKDIRFIQFVLDKYVARYESEKKQKKHSALDMSEDRVVKARSVPIYQVKTFNGSGFTNCLWHHEKTGSLKYYKDSNRVHCFGCGKNADVIDVVMKLRECTFTEAIEFLIGP